MITSLLTVFLACLATIVLSAPALDAATILKNGQEAQRLNIFFQTLNETDTCTSTLAAGSPILCFFHFLPACAISWNTSLHIR